MIRRSSRLFRLLGSRTLVRCPPPINAPRIQTIRCFSINGATISYERPRRSLFNCPGSDARKIEKAKGLGVDALVLDLEDGVAQDQKDVARSMIQSVLATMDENNKTQNNNSENENSSSMFGRSEVCIRINGLDTKSLCIQDLQTLLPYASLDTIVIPKVEQLSDIHFVRRMIDAYAPSPKNNTNNDTNNTNNSKNIRLLAAIESAVGMQNLSNIASANVHNYGANRIVTPDDAGYLDGLIFASEDYCADLEMIRTDTANELLYPRSKLVTVAKSYQLQAIDMVHIQFQDMEGLAVECQTGKEMGFTGKQAIHPKQIDTIHQVFSPSIEEVSLAQEMVDTYQTTVETTGKGACVVQGIVVDAPVYKWAQKILQRHASAAVDHSN